MASRTLPVRALLLTLLLAGTAGCTSSLDSSRGDGDIGLELEDPPVFRFDGLRVATLNTEFLFDGYGEEGAATFDHKGDPDKARAHRDRIAEIIRWIDADLLMLQEVEHREAMELLVQESLGDMGYTVYFVQGTDSFTGQDVGLLSRLPVEEVGRTDERAPVGGTSDTYGVSKNMYARVQLDGLPVTLIGVHFLAQPLNDGRIDRREAQAEVIRRLAAAEAAAGRSLVVLGDFNDYDDAALDAAASRPVTDVMRTIKAAGPGPDDDLRNLMDRVPQNDRYTVIWDRNDNNYVDSGELRAIDHILLSSDLYDRVLDVQYVQAHDPFAYTDHFPVVATLEAR